MATIPFVKMPSLAAGGFNIQWPTMANGDVGQAFVYPSRADRTVQVKGTAGGATVYLEGSLDEDATGQTWTTLSDPNGNDLDIAPADKQIETILENVYQTRPRIAGGDGTTALTVTILYSGR